MTNFKEELEKEFEEIDMNDHAVAQGILSELDKYNCLSEKGKIFKKMYFKKLDEHINLGGKKESLLDEEYKKELKTQMEEKSKLKKPEISEETEKFFEVEIPEGKRDEYDLEGYEKVGDGTDGKGNCFEYFIKYKTTLKEEKK